MSFIYGLANVSEDITFQTSLNIIQIKANKSEKKKPKIIIKSKVQQHQLLSHFIHLTFQIVNSNELNNTIPHQKRCSP